MLQQQVASQLSADFDDAEIRVQLKVASLKQLKARNLILEAAIKVAVSFTIYKTIEKYDKLFYQQDYTKCIFYQTFGAWNG